jgi:hypothetical protein
MNTVAYPNNRLPKYTNAVNSTALRGTAPSCTSRNAISIAARPAGRPTAQMVSSQFTVAKPNACLLHRFHGT